MIGYYEFINGNGSGEKEPRLTATTELYNKLSAEETNRIKDKLNELVDAANANGVPLYPNLALKFKGDGNLNLAALEVGDIVHGLYDANTIWTNAIYNGGDPTDKANYTPIYEVKPDPILFTAPITGAGQTFILPDGFVVGSVLKSRGELYKGTEWSQDDAELTIIVNANAGNTIYVKP